MSAGGRWRVYVLRCGDGSLYTGIATDVARRLAEHEAGRRGAKYLRGRGPLTVVLEIGVADRPAALRLERRIKRLARRDKERMLTSAAGRRRLLAGADVRGPRRSQG